jgi:hypothetical protein
MVAFINLELNMIVDCLNGTHEVERFGHPHLFEQPCLPISLPEKLCFFRSFAWEKWPLRGSEKPEIPPNPPLQRGARGDLSRMQRIFHSYQHAGISLALSAYYGSLPQALMGIPK